MQDVYVTEIVLGQDPSTFIADLNNKIQALQAQRLTVEVQFSPTAPTRLCALLVCRTERR